MELTDNLMAFVERKLFHAEHRSCYNRVYLGKLAGHQTIRDAILDESIRAVVKGAMEEKRRGADQTLLVLMPTNMRHTFRKSSVVLKTRI